MPRHIAIQPGQLYPQPDYTVAVAGANNALFYTLLANCRAQGLDPEAYLIEVIKRLPHDATTEQAADLTPVRIAGEREAARQSA